MDTFASSLRSSPTKSSGRKSTRSSFVAGGSARAKPSSSPAQQNKPSPLPSQQVSDYASNPSKFFDTKLKNSRPLSAIDRSTWEPPLSCQKRLLSFAGRQREQVYFPLELSTSDYIQKIYRLVSMFMTVLYKEKMTLQLSGAVSSGSSVAFSTWVDIICLLSKPLNDEKPNFIRFLYDLMNSIGNGDKLSPWDEYFRVMVNVYEQSVAITWPAPAAAAAAATLETVDGSPFLYFAENGKLADVDLSFTIFAAARMILKSIVSSRVVCAVSSPPLATYGAQILEELEQLEQQHNLHSSFKEQRMSRLSWQWWRQQQQTAGTGGGGSQQHPLSIDIEGAMSAAAATASGGPGSRGRMHDEEREQEVENSLLEAADVKRQLQALLQPTTLANVMLFHRLLSIAQDLDNLGRALSEDCEYDEAARLRALHMVVDDTVTHQGRSLLDQARFCCQQADLLVTDLRHYSDECKLKGPNAFLDRAQRSDSNARDLHALKAQLWEAGCAGFTLLSQPEVVEQLAAQGSSFITSNFLFTHPHPQSALQHQQRAARGEEPVLVNIGSLVIRAGSNSVLNAIRHTWPDMTALKVMSAHPSASASGGASSSMMFHSPAAAGRDFLTTLSSVAGSGADAGAGMFPVAAESNATTPFTINRHAYVQRQMLEAAGRGGGGDGGDGGLLSSREELTASLEQMFPELDRYNDVGFSPKVLAVLVSFEELQKQLQVLLSPPAVALTLLLQRLLGVSEDLHGLAGMNQHSGQYDESDRLLTLRAAVEATIDADTGDSAPCMQLACGRGRRRLDNIRQLMEQVGQGSRELQRLAIRCRTEHDFTGAQALDGVAADLRKCAGETETSLLPFSLLDSENGMNVLDAGLEINELIAREGTPFMTADYIFQFSCGAEGHSIGSLAIVAGAGAILRNIRNEWPNLTALSAPNGGGGLGGIGGATATGGGGGSSLQHHLEDEDLLIHAPATATATGARSPVSAAAYEMEAKASLSNPSAMNTLSPLIVSSMMSPAAADANTTGSQANSPINFRDANSLRLLGFDAASLRLAGFSDIAVVTAGYTATELRDASFSAEELRAAAGLADSALRVVGYQTEQQLDVLADLFRATEGPRWKLDHTASSSSGGGGGGGSAAVSVASRELGGWRELHRMRREQQQQQQQQQQHGGSSNGLLTSPPSASAAVAASTSGALAAMRAAADSKEVRLTQHLHGVTTDAVTGEVTKLVLSSMNLTGILPANIGCITSITQLVLSNNNLSGPLPSCLGLLVNIEHLFLDRNQFEGEIPKTFKSLDRLSILKLECNKLSGSIPSVLGALTRLRRLDLSFNRFSGAIFPRLTQLENLQELLLNNNQLTGCIPPSIGNLANLTSLQLQGNLLQGQMPGSIGKLTKLTGLNIQNNIDMNVDRLQLQRTLPRCRIKI